MCQGYSFSLSIIAGDIYRGKTVTTWKPIQSFFLKHYESCDCKLMAIQGLGTLKRGMCTKAPESLMPSSGPLKRSTQTQTMLSPQSTALQRTLNMCSLDPGSCSPVTQACSVDSLSPTHTHTQHTALPPPHDTTVTPRSHASRVLPTLCQSGHA